MSSCCEFPKVIHSRDKVQLTGMHEIWVEVILVIFLYAVATVVVIIANSNDVNLAKTRYVHFA